MSSPTRTNQRVKPTLETKFHIDYDWWKREDRDLRSYLISHLLPEQRPLFESADQASDHDHLIDWIDPETAEVRRVDSLQQALAVAAKDSQFITDKMTLVDAVFRAFLANGNKPMSPEEIGRIIRKPPATILKTLTGVQVYKGLRPVAEQEDAR